MTTSLTIGQYYPENSVIHLLDPRMKLLLTLLLIVLMFIIDGFLSYLAIIAGLFAIVALARVPVGLVLRGLRGIFFIVLMTGFVNIFFTSGGATLFHYGIITITDEGLIAAVKMCLRLCLLVAGSSILTLTTSSTALADGVEFSLKPLKRLRVPVHEIAMMMTIALRFIPTLMEETEKIMKAQAARGADFDTGGLIRKAKALVPILVPLFISAFTRAYELAAAMESRCYRGDIGRTRMKVLRFQRKDYAALAAFLAFAATAFMAGRII